MDIQMRQGKMPEVGQGDFWILSCNLYEDAQKHHHEIPFVYLLIKHDYSCNKDGESSKPMTVLHFDEHSGEFRIIVTEDEYSLMAEQIFENEGVSMAEAEEHLREKYATDEYCRVVHGWNPLYKSKEMWKRWQAIKLLVTPHVTL